MAKKATTKKATKKTTAKKGDTEERNMVEIPELSIEEVTFRITGVTPLIVHKWDEKMKGDIRRKKVEGDKTKNRENQDPAEVAEAGTYRLSDGSPGFPVTGIKKAIWSAAHKDLGFPKTHIQKGLFIPGDEGDLARVYATSEKVREDVVKLGSGMNKVADLRWRTQFDDWYIDLQCQLDSDWLNVTTLMNLAQRAGFGIGIGEWRPEKGGDFGRFTVVR